MPKGVSRGARGVEKRARGDSVLKKKTPRSPLSQRAPRETLVVVRTPSSALQRVLRDVHSEEDGRKLDLERAGVKGLRYPICVLDRANGQQHTVAEIDMSVSLPHRRRGAHMSRFVELLNRHRREIDVRRFRALCAELRRDHDASAAHVTVRFPYFIEKRAPVSGATGLVDYSCTYSASVSATADELWVSVEVPVTSLCPCSKAISRRGAHNQRSIVRVKVWFARFFWLEDLIALVEESASCDLYAVLKRRSVRIDDKGNLLLDCPGYQAESTGGSAAAAVVLPSIPVAGASLAPASLSKHYFLVTEQSDGAAAQYDIDVYVNSKWVRKV